MFRMKNKDLGGVWYGTFNSFSVQLDKAVKKIKLHWIRNKYMCLYKQMTDTDYSEINQQYIL